MIVAVDLASPHELANQERPERVRAHVNSSRFVPCSLQTASAAGYPAGERWKGLHVRRLDTGVVFRLPGHY
jgi:hypothetical protein